MSAPYKILCEDTSKLPKPEWLTTRAPYVGSSEAAATAGLSPWESTYGLWARKRGLVSSEIPDTERFWWGRVLEPLILQRWAFQYERPVPRQHLMMASTLYPWMAANPDGVIPGACVEAKTADPWDEARWESGVPTHYLLQGLHQCIVYGVRRCYFPVLFGFHLTEFIVDYAEDEVESLVAAERAFWRRVQENDAPDPDGSEATMIAIREQLSAFERGATVDLPADAEEWIATRTQYDALAKASLATADAAKQRLMLAMGAGTEGLIDGEVAVTFRPDKNGTRSLRIPPKRKVVM